MRNRAGATSARFRTTQPIVSLTPQTTYTVGSGVDGAPGRPPRFFPIGSFTTGTAAPAPTGS